MTDSKTGTPLRSPLDRLTMNGETPQSRGTPFPLSLLKGV